MLPDSKAARPPFASSEAVLHEVNLAASGSSLSARANYRRRAGAGNRCLSREVGTKPRDHHSE
jgi:hypothetical protein